RRCRRAYRPGYGHRALRSSRTTLRRTFHQHQAALETRDGVLDQLQYGIHLSLIDVENVRGDSVRTHPACHLHALEHSAGVRATADRTGLAVHRLSTVAHRLPVETVPLNGAREALALAGADDVDNRAALEHLCGELLAYLVIIGIGGAHF